MLQKLCVLFVISLISWQTFALGFIEKSQLFLVGGGLKTCSSMSLKNCDQETQSRLKKSSTAKKSSLYKIDQNSLKWLVENWPFSKETQSLLLPLLTELKSDQLLNAKQLKDKIRKHDKNGLVKALNDVEYYVLLDGLEQPIIVEGKRRQEVVNLNSSTHYFSTEIYRSFVNEAKKISQHQKPNVLVLTASARDPFEAVDFYQNVFEQAGANSQWIPLDAALNVALQQDGNRTEVCNKLPVFRLKTQRSVRREIIYPDLHQKQLDFCLNPLLLLEKIEQADGVFINGGDQSLTAQAFVNIDGSDSEALSLIRKKLADKSLVIGGTSAGTAVMSGGLWRQHSPVMITNGDSRVAVIRGAKKNMLPIAGCQKLNSCDDLLNGDLTFNSNGGLKLFPWGILDTHFSERGRQGRLSVLVSQTNSPFGFGVDEATALVVSHNSSISEFSVIGEGGIYIVDNSLETNRQVLTHYVTRNDQFSLNGEGKLSIKFAPWKIKPVGHDEKLQGYTDIFYRDKLDGLLNLFCQSKINKLDATDVWRDEEIQINIEKQIDSKSAIGAIEVGGKIKSYCSYQNYAFTF